MEGGRRHQLILFDIDGTLIHTGGAGGRAMTRAFAEVCRVENGFEGVLLPGRTDPLILADALVRSGIDTGAGGGATPRGAAVVERFQVVYYRYLEEELLRAPVSAGVRPGIEALLRRLHARPATTVGLLTGNYSTAARLKLERFNLWHFFDTGAFGEDASDRNGLVAVAEARLRERGMPAVERRHIVVIGDTPLDVACGRANGARTLAVATGGYDVDALRASGADAVLHDLGSTERVLALLDRWAFEPPASC